MGKRLRHITAIFAVLCLLDLALQEWTRATQSAAWTLLGLAWLHQDRRRPKVDRFAPEANARGGRRAALAFGVGSVIWLASATLQPEHPASDIVHGAVLAILAGLSLGASFLAITPRGERFLERLRQKDALKKGSPADPAPAAAAAPTGKAGTTWQEPPYFSST